MQVRRLCLGAVAGGLLAAAAGCSPGAASAAAPLTVDVHMRFSKFVPSTLTVPEDREVRFVIHNDDFIDHEFIVGDAAVQQRHEYGTEPHHGELPTEVDVPAGETVTTIVKFPRRAELPYACHLPGHYAYGMTGTLRVR